MEAEDVLLQQGGFRFEAGEQGLQGFRGGVQGGAVERGEVVVEKADLGGEGGEVSMERRGEGGEGEAQEGEGGVAEEGGCLFIGLLH